MVTNILGVDTDLSFTVSVRMVATGQPALRVTPPDATSAALRVTRYHTQYAVVVKALG
jgi:hypothetical protein